MASLDRRIEELVRIYQRAESALDALIQRATGSGRAAEARYRQNVRRQVVGILDQMSKEGKPGAERAVLAAYEEGLRAAAASGATNALRGGFGGPHRPAIRVLTEQLVSRLEETRVIVGRSVDDVFRQETLRAAAERLARGNSVPQGAAALEHALRRRGVTGYVDSAGRQWSLGDYARMAIVTTTAQAQSSALDNRMAENDLDLIEITTHVHKADVCSPYDGKTFSRTGATPGFPKIDRLPPFHPFCRHKAFASRLNFLPADERPPRRPELVVA